MSTSDHLDSPTSSVTSKNSLPASSNELEQLLALSSEGDQSAFSELYLRTSAHLYAVLRRILKVESIAEEALQETYVKIWNNAHTYKQELGAPITWMNSVARYHALDLLRRRQTREDLESEYVPDHPGHEFVTQHLLDDQLASREVLTVCLDRLDDSAKSCIVQAYCEGYSQEELSQQKKAPLGTVKSWIRRGLLALKECIDELS